MKGRFLTIVFAFCLGILTALILNIPVTDTHNPLSSSLTLRDRILVWYYTKPIKPCLGQDDQQNVFGCVNKTLKTISRKHGARLALNVIEPISKDKPLLLMLGHDLAHTIGDNALYASYGTVKGFRDIPLDALIQKMGKVIVDCDGWGSFGCYHGVIEVALTRLDPSMRTQVVRKACLENPLVTSKQFYLNQCMHWFGHSMAIFTDQTLEQTLAMCEGVSKDFFSDEVQLCLSGVFHAGALPGTSDQTYLDNVSRVYSKDDVYFPCEGVEERFQQHCFSHVVGRSHTSDLSIMMRNCDGIPEADIAKKHVYVQGCYESIGNNLLFNADFKADGVARECDEYGVPEYAGYCYGGAARYSVLRDPLMNNMLPFEICKLAPESAKKTCYSLIGFANFENYKSPDKLAEYCSYADPEYRAQCSSWSPRI